MTDTSLWYSLSKLISYIVITKNLRSICKSYNKMVIGSFIPRYNMAKAMIGIIILMSIYYVCNMYHEPRIIPAGYIRSSRFDGSDVEF